MTGNLLPYNGPDSSGKARQDKARGRRWGCGSARVEKMRKENILTGGYVLDDLTLTQ